jgi:hypothetical protein
MTELKDLVGKHMLECAARTDIRHPFDSDGEGIAWAMDGKIYIAFQDVDDGYRSSCAPLLVGDGNAYSLWSPEYIMRQVVGRHVTKGEYDEGSDILELVDVKTGHVWLRVGTENIGDYYPWFVAQWFPMEAGQ